MTRSSLPSSTRFSPTSELRLTAGRSATVDAWALWLPLACITLGAVGIVGGDPAHAATLPGAWFLRRLFRGMDPAGCCLGFNARHGWTIRDEVSTEPSCCHVLPRGAFVRSLLVEVRLPSGSPAHARRYLLLAADAFEDRQWRRLRRALRLTAPLPRAADQQPG